MTDNPKPVFRVASGLELILASASPRRKELLSSIGLSFAVQRFDATEPAPEPGEDITAFARRGAKSKCRDCLARLNEAGSHAILAADTIVGLDGQIFGKPENGHMALETLRKLNGRAHLVVTAFCLWLPHHNDWHLEACHSAVRFHKWPDAVLKAYAASGDSLDKAGAYGIQGPGAFLIESITGSWSNVAGLPLARTAAALLRFGIIEPAGNQTACAP